MRKNLGRFLLLLLLVSTTLVASTYNWKATANKLNVVTQEAVHLTYTCEFSDRAELFVIDFNPVIESEEYSIILLSESQKIRDFKRINTYEFVAFIHKPGRTTFEFNVAMKMTNKDSIENSVLGRDNEEYEEYTTEFIKQKPLTLNVVTSHSNIVGNIEMKIESENPNIKAYTPYNFEVQINGVGNLHKIKPIHFDIEGVKIFTEKPKKDFHLTADGYKGSWSQKFSFVGSKDFTIPPFFLKVYDLKTQTLQKLQSKKITLHVDPVYKKEQLIDTEEKHSQFDLSYLYYLLTFIAGFLLSKVKIKMPSKENPKSKILKDKILQTKTKEELLMLLILQNSPHFKELMKEIEKNKNLSLSDAKKSACELIKN